MAVAEHCLGEGKICGVKKRELGLLVSDIRRGIRRIEGEKKREEIRKVGLPGIEPGTSRLSGARSNRLSYKPARSVLENGDISYSERNVNYTS